MEPLIPKKNYFKKKEKSNSYFQFFQYMYVPPVYHKNLKNLLLNKTCNFRYNETPVIKASGRELSYILLFSMIMCYSMTFVLVSKPTPLICAIKRTGITQYMLQTDNFQTLTTTGSFVSQLSATVETYLSDLQFLKQSIQLQFCHHLAKLLANSSSRNLCQKNLLFLGIGFAFSCLYASLLVKTNRIARIFSQAKRTVQRPRCISPISQVLLTVLLAGVQLIGSLIWLSAVPPGNKPLFSQN